MREFWYPRSRVKGLVASGVYFFPTLIKLFLFLRRHQINLVLLEYPVPHMFYFYILRMMVPYKICVDLHGSDVIELHRSLWFQQSLVRGMIRCADWVLAHSASLMDEAQRIVGPLKGKCSYLHNWVDCDRIRERAKSIHGTKSLPDGPFVLTAAKLYPRKALDVLLQAISRIMHSVEGCQFVIAGDGPEEGRLREMAKAPKVDELVRFVGDIPNDEIPAWFSRCELFVLPSRSEPFGIVLLEAMTFGKAIVATRVGGIPEFVTHGFNGLLVPSEDSDALAESIRILLVDKELRSAIGRNGLERVEKEFNVKSLMGKYESLFESIRSARR